VQGHLEGTLCCGTVRISESVFPDFLKVFHDEYALRRQRFIPDLDEPLAQILVARRGRTESVPAIDEVADSACRGLRKTLLIITW
jgi:hypothetical protein